MPADVVADIVTRSEGNPFFAEELLATKTECNDLPAGLAEVLLSRLERLSPDTRRVVRVISVANEPVMHAALADICGLGELELDEALREAVQHHVLVVLSDGSYTFRHALLQEAVYGDLLPGERSRTHAAYAARIQARPQGRGHDAKLAYHSMQSSDLVTALPALLRAMDEAEKLGAPGSALQHVEQALSIWDAVPKADRPEGFDELRLLHEASYFAGTSGEPERAAAFARSATQALTPETSADRAAKTWRRLAEALLALEGTLDEATAAMDRAWDLVKDTEPSGTRAWVLAGRAGFLRILEQPEAALESARTAVADAQAVGAAGAEAAALVTAGHARRLRRRSRRGARMAAPGAAEGAGRRRAEHRDPRDLLPRPELRRPRRVRRSAGARRERRHPGRRGRAQLERLRAGAARAAADLALPDGRLAGREREPGRARGVERGRGAHPRHLVAVRRRPRPVRRSREARRRAAAALDGGHADPAVGRGRGHPAGVLAGRARRGGAPGRGPRSAGWSGSNPACWPASGWPRSA